MIFFMTSGLSRRGTPDDKAYSHYIVEALKPETEWLIMGLLELIKHFQKNDHQMSDRAVSVNTVTIQGANNSWLNSRHLCTNERKYSSGHPMNAAFHTHVSTP